MFLVTVLRCLSLLLQIMGAEHVWTDSHSLNINKENARVQIQNNFWRWSKEKKQWRWEEFRRKMLWEGMMGNTHSDMRETFSHHQVQWHLAWPQPPFNSKDLLVVVPLNRLIIILSITLSSRQQMTTTIGGKRQGRSSGGAKTLIYIPLRNWDCISLLWAAVYCVWLSNGGKKWNREGMSWLLSHQSCSLCGDLPAVPAVCSYKLSNPNTQPCFHAATNRFKHLHIK